MSNGELVKSILPIVIASAITMAALSAAAEIPFDGEMTNRLGWTWNDRIKSNSNGYYIGGQGAVIVSPEFAETVIGVTLKYRRSASCSRDLCFMPGDVHFEPSDAEGEVSVRWFTDDNVHQFEIRSDTGSQMLYLVSVTVKTILQPSAPTGFSVYSASGTNATLRWQTDEPNARLILETIVQTPESYDRNFHYDFVGLTNTTTRIKAVGDDFWEGLPGFSGSRIYIPANSTNEIQISAADDIGNLVYAGGNSMYNVTLVPQVKRYDSKNESSVMNFAWALDGETNDFATVALDTQYSSPIIPLSDVPDGAELIFNSSGNRGNHRILVKAIDFYTEYAAADAYTNCLLEVSSATSPFKLTELEPETWYRCRLFAVSESGVDSPPVEVEFITPKNGPRPFVMILR